MTYRDDREALHHRVAQLEQELQDARREGEEHGRDEAQARAAALEQKLTEMRGEVEKMGAELQALRGDKPRAGVSVPLVLGALSTLVLVAGGVVFLTVRSSPPPPPPPRPAQVAAVEPQASPIPLEPVDTAAPVPTVAPTPPSPPRSATARWNAKVTRAEGLAIAPGSTCTVDARIVTNGTNALVPDLTIQCGAQSLYRSSDRLNGMSQRSNDARELLGPSDDKSTFTLTYSDLGTRTGERGQVDLDTPRGQASVFRDTNPRFRVELSLPKTSVPGAPLSGPDERLRRAGKVAKVTGAPPVKEGASCLLRAMPTGKRSECAAEVACGTTIIWAASAPVKCTYDGSRPAGISTEEGATSLSLEGSTLTVKAKAFGAEITLEGP